jgi:predicted transcriptional regulator
MSKNTVRLSIDLSPSLDRVLEDLATRMGTTKAEVLRKGIALVEVAADAKAAGKKIGVADRADQLTREIVGL